MNFWYYFGSLAMFVLVIQILSGLFLTMNYKPSAADAFGSVEYIMRDVEWGWLIRYIHSTGASAFFIVVYLHMFRAILYGSYQKPRELLWIFGMIIYFLLMGEAFFGYLLPWGNMSYWGAQVIVSLFGAVPVDRRRADGVRPRRLLHLRHHAEPVLRAARHRAAVRAGVPRHRAPDGAARGRFEQPGRRRDQEGQGPGRHPARRHRVPPVLHGQGHGRRRRVPDLLLPRDLLRPDDGRLLPRGARTSIPRTRCRRRRTSRRCGTSRRTTRSCAPCRARASVRP